MAKFVFSICLLWLMSCGENNQTDTDSPAAVDSTAKHPDGMINGSVISTDTAAMRVNDSISR